MSNDLPADLRLDGRVALVTGAGGAIGQAITTRLLGLGATVARADVDPATLPATPSDRTSEHALDVRDEAACRRAVAETVSAHGRLDLLVNNAGIMIRADAQATDAPTWDAVMDVNLSGAFRMARAARGALAATGNGSIVSLSSTHAFLAAREALAYSTSKAGLSHLTRMLAFEWAPEVRVNAVAPGIVASAMSADVMADPEFMRAKLAAIPLGRAVLAEHVAATIAFLASDAAGSITGQVLPIDGGELLP
jgi:NAD(P)-dependent dehydrogenase (short-subunit alcohol dehydrogenase family)